MTTINDNKYLENFCNYMLFVKGRSKNSILVYNNALIEFFKFIYNNRNLDLETPLTKELLESITCNDGRAYLAHCANKGNNAVTRNRKAITIRTFYTYLKDVYNIHSNIIKLELAKTEKRLPKYLTETEALNLLAYAKDSKRNYAIILMFLTCGLRVNEMTELNRNAIKNDNTMLIIGKGNKQRKIYLTQECVDAVNDYLSTRDDDNICMWLNKDGERISKIGIQFMVKGYLEKIGRGDCSVNKLRHTFATLMYQSGAADLLQLKEMLGHDDVKTTQIYTHIAEEQLAECVKHNPLVNKKPKLIIMAG